MMNGQARTFSGPDAAKFAAAVAVRPIAEAFTNAVIEFEVECYDTCNGLSAELTVLTLDRNCIAQ
jgi:hypothetical protein